MDGRAHRYLIAVLADDDGFIPIPYEKWWRPAFGVAYYPVNPFTFAKNFRLSKDDMPEDHEIGKWKFDLDKSEDVYLSSSDETEDIVKQFDLRKKLHMEMPEHSMSSGEIWRIRCHRNTKHPKGEKVGRYGYIFRARPHIITALEKMEIAYEMEMAGKFDQESGNQDKA